MNKRILTLFVLTNDASKARQLKVPLNFFKAAGIATIAFILVFGFIVFDYARLKWSEFELASLRKENTQQRIELQGFASKIRDLEAQIAKLNVFDRKLRVIANLEDKNGQRPGQVMGMGGEEITDEDIFATPGAKVNELVDRMKDDLVNLESQAKTQETSFSALQEHLLKQSSMLASTPSVWPARGWVTSTFGSRISPFTGYPQLHRGMDIANRVGTPVTAPADGIVVKTGFDTGLGKMVVISHGYGIKTTYGHMAEVSVKAGQRVKRGARLGAIGNTGRSTGPHLHYEVSFNGVSVNPSKYILD